MAQVHRRIAAAPEDTTILFADETELKRFPPLRHMWQPVGQQRPVRVPDANDDFALYGALGTRSGRTLTRAFEKERSDYTIQFLELLKARTTGNVLLKSTSDLGPGVLAHLRPSGSVPSEWKRSFRRRVASRRTCCPLGLRRPIRWRTSGES
jgi:hypothetical protein